METTLDDAFKPLGMSGASKTRCINYTAPTNGLIFSTNLVDDGPPPSSDLSPPPPPSFIPISNFRVVAPPFGDMRAHKPITNHTLASIMRPINVSLCSKTWEIAKTIPNFSAWVRARLEERATNNKKRWDKPKEEWIIYDAKGRKPEEK